MNLIRLLLAGFVVASHCLPISGRGVGLYFGHGELSMFAVDAFFVISGFLITGSRLGLPAGRYLWHRCLRIFPAYWTCLVVTAFVAAPVAWLHRHSSLGGFFTSAHDPFVYVLRNIALVVNVWDVSGTPAHVPVAAKWDGSLWTLSWEFACYLTIAVLGALGLLARRRLLLGLSAALWAVLAFHAFVPSVATVVFVHLDAPTRFSLLFSAGMLLHLYQDRVPFSDVLAGVAVAWLLVVYRFDPHPYVLIGPPLAYVCLWLSARLPAPAVLRRHDLSYGLYIYAMPAQQLLVLYGVARWNLGAFYAASFAAGLALATASWFAVERRALRLKDYSPRFLARADSGPPAEAGVPATRPAPVDPAAPVAR
ncbi:acyltransferase family protein [Pseudofrankia inefficax]|nr:acyltransferase [Pseudofrankia inefficax]